MCAQRPGISRKTQVPEFKPRVCLIYSTSIPLFPWCLPYGRAAGRDERSQPAGRLQPPGQALPRDPGGGSGIEVPGQARPGAALRGEPAPGPEHTEAARPPSRRPGRLRAELSRGRPRPARPERGAAPRPGPARSRPRRGPARPHLPARAGERRPRPLGHGAALGPARRGSPGTGPESEQGRGARSIPRPAGLSPRSGRPGREGRGREGAEGRRKEGRGGGGAGRDEQSPRPAAAWRAPPPWREGRSGGSRACGRAGAGRVRLEALRL